MDIRNFRSYPDHHGCYLFGMFWRLKRYGPLRTLPRIDSRLAKEHVTGIARSDLLSLKASIFSRWQDISRAKTTIKEAMEISPEDSWVHVQHTSILEQADQY